MPYEPPLPRFLPTTLSEAQERGWTELDVIFVTGDAYVDHSSFAPALLGRMLEAKGFRVGIIARPRPDSTEDIARLGKPKLFFAVAPGCVDSMVNNYTAQKRPRRDDDYAPGGVSGNPLEQAQTRRPNRALIVYCNMIRRAFGGSAGILAGGIEASLRRFAHYDFWDDAVRRPILLDAPADGLVYGMGELPLQEIAQAMRSRTARESAAETQSDLLAAVVRTVRGAVYRTPASTPAPEGWHGLPPFEEVRSKPEAQVRTFREEMKFREAGVYQDCGGYRVVANPPARPLTTPEMDALYSLRFRREAHSSYKERVPALEQVRFSITSHRGCFGGCAFCGLYTHQGKAVQSRSRESVLHEVKEIVRHPGFDGTIRDIGGPTANMWMMSCRHGRPCQRPSCLAPRLCKDLDADGKRYLELLDAARKTKGVKHLFVTTGVRMDLALACEPFVDDFAAHYTSGHAKVAPEHFVPEILRLMLKPEGDLFLRFLDKFRRASVKAGKEQYVLPYIIAAHPGSRVEDMVEVALYLKHERLRVEQCQIFIPLPGTASAVMYATEINPFDGKQVFVEREPRRREMQKALVLYHLPESRKLVLEALEACGRMNVARVLLPSWVPPPRPPDERRVSPPDKPRAIPPDRRWTSLPAARRKSPPKPQPAAPRRTPPKPRRPKRR